MPLLDCSVHKCAYNKDCLCSKHEIKVDGETATTSDKTCCQSFKEANCNNATNSTSNIASRSTGVACDAVKCLYNDNHYCSANQIGIVGANATNAESTECATFKAK